MCFIPRLRRLLAAGTAACALLAAPAVAAAQTIQVVTEATPWTYLEGGRVAGPATEIVTTALQRAGLTDTSINLYPWARAYDLALKEPHTLIFLIARTPAREAQFKWVGEFMKIDYHFYRLKTQADVVVGRLDDARRYTVGVTRDDLRHQYLQQRGFSKLVVSAHNMDNFRKLIAGQVQLMPMPEDDALALCREARFDCAGLEKVHTLADMSTGIHAAYSLATPDAVVDRTRQAFDKLRADGTVRRLMTLRR
ncbi:substrate-binding periplasmic protein [Aquincola tertiaricarbonis]|uniref:substrate-binding periplasmic protein n=1 Tax=Aquincola tertiaricarbonis TaxID=391953 RepID=UPI000614F10A|nr:transporter substrate-binding domain-containing protein [Aquincola tertiaricarbonis]